MASRASDNNNENVHVVYLVWLLLLNSVYVISFSQSTFCMANKTWSLSVCVCWHHLFFSLIHI